MPYLQDSELLYWVFNLNIILNSKNRIGNLLIRSQRQPDSWNFHCCEWRLLFLKGARVAVHLRSN